MKLRIATRKSPLAVWQAEHVKAELQQREAGLDVELVLLSTRGDKILDQALSKVGGKDLFVKEIEQALFDGRAEIAVHSLKDVPTEMPEGLQITAYPPREDPRDAVVSEGGYTLKTLPEGATVGTCSLRRAAQLLRHRPDLNIVPIRGNVQTRLKRMKEQGMHATMLAYAGLKRLEMADLASEVLEPEVCLPAIGQGILAVQTRVDDSETNRLVAMLDDPTARIAACSERAFLARLEGGCQVPIAGHLIKNGEQVHLRGMVSSLDGKRVFEGDWRGPEDQAEAEGVALAERLLDAGAGPILAALKAEA